MNRGSPPLWGPLLWGWSAALLSLSVAMAKVVMSRVMV